MDKEKDTTIQKNKTEAMCKKYVVILHVVVMSILNVLIFCFHVSAASTDFAFELDQDTDTTIRKHVAMIHGAVFLWITCSLCVVTAAVTGSGVHR
jgi:hypothetical protein